MKRLFALCCFSLISSTVFSQDTTTVAVIHKHHDNVLTLTAGIGDWQKQHYKLPDSSAFGSSAGFTPITIKFEHFFSSSISASANLSYDWFYYSYSQKGYTNGVLFYRPQTDKVRIISPGIELYYHFNRLLPAKWDLFIGLGINGNYVYHSNYPKTDSTTGPVQAQIAPTVRLGVRYYFSPQISTYLDAGYDKTSVINIGFSYRFTRK